ncbi:hypothetical protein, partial [Streptomyces sp. GbtcB7]|uniref:hypothetical protein n=1 Tax=Streptomyces sp. GbtcB7 TaxID=2824752 RepID=UPI001C2FAB15
KGDATSEADLATWRAANEPTLQAIHDTYRSTIDEGWHEEDLTEEELEELDYNLVGGGYRLDDMVAAAFVDLDQLTKFMNLVLAGAGLDDKFARLRTLLMGPSSSEQATLDGEVFTEEFRTQPVIVFTEFADTAR